MTKLFLLAGLVAQAAPVPSQIQERIGQSINAEAKASDLQAPQLPPGISLDRPLGAEEAVAIALWNNAAFHADLANLGLARADLAEAGLLRNPNLSLLFPIGPKPFEFLLTLPIEALWERPRRVDAAKANLEAVSQGLVQHGLDLARDTRLAWVELALAQRRNALESETADLRLRIADLTDRRLRAGDIGKVEVDLARAQAVMARDSAQRAADDVRVARERLRLLIGLRGDRSELSARSLQEPSAEVPELDTLLESAFAARPDLRAAEFNVRAAAQRARWERSRLVALGFSLSSKEVGSYGVRTGPGMTLDVPLFDRNQGAVSRADAEVEHAAWQYLAARDRVELEVREARVRYVQARQSLQRLRLEMLPAIRLNAEMVEKSYRTGEVSYLTVLEASRPLLDVRLREAEAIAALVRSAAQLERSIGRKP